MHIENILSTSQSPSWPDLVSPYSNCDINNDLKGLNKNFREDKSKDKIKLEWKKCVDEKVKRCC